jgi:hypothetical protein
MKKAPELILWFIVIAILLWPLVYVITSDLEPNFWSNVASGIIGTAAALIGGIPVALYIDRVIKSKEEQKTINENKVNEKGLLRLIKEELEVCQSMMEGRTNNPDNLHIQPLKSDLWHAAKNSGKLSLISNHSLLNDIASVYYQIDMVKDIETQGYKAARSATVSFGGGGTATELLFQDARSFDNLLNGNLEEVITLINTHI